MWPLCVTRTLLAVRKFAVAVTLAWIFATAGCGAFGPEPPESLREAASNADWATARIAELPVRQGGKTQGILYRPGAAPLKSESGEFGEYNYAKAILKGSEKSATQPELLAAASHVEVKAAALMRKQKVSYAVLVINNTDGVCGDSTTGVCTTAVPIVLPDSYRLMVWWPDQQRRAQGPKALDGKGSS